MAGSKFGMPHPYVLYFPLVLGPGAMVSDAEELGIRYCICPSHFPYSERYQSWAPRRARLPAVCNSYQMKKASSEELVKAE